MRKFLSMKRTKFLVFTMLVFMMSFGIVSNATAHEDITGDPATYTAKSMLSTESTNIVSNFGANVVLTVTAIIGITVAVGLTIWGIKYGVFTGLNWIKRYAKSKA